MRNYKLKDFKNVLKKNGYKSARMNGSHEIFERQDGDIISIPTSSNDICGPMAKRLIKEHNLKE